MVALTKRVCATEGCATVLSRYNSRPNCSLHLRAAEHGDRPLRESATKRQQEIIDLIGDGASTVRVIADRMGISQQQTSEHLRALLADGRVERRREPIPGQHQNHRFVYAVAVDLEALMAEA